MACFKFNFCNQMFFCFVFFVCFFSELGMVIGFSVLGIVVVLVLTELVAYVFGRNSVRRLSRKYREHDYSYDQYMVIHILR